MEQIQKKIQLVYIPIGSKNTTRIIKKNDILLLKSEDLSHSEEKILVYFFRFLNVVSENYTFNSEMVNSEKDITKDKGLAGENIKKLNSNVLYNVIKQILKPLRPILKSIQSELFYKKRMIREMTLVNKNYLREKYSKDLAQLEKETKILFNYGY